MVCFTTYYHNSLYCHISRPRCRKACRLWGKHQLPPIGSRLDSVMLHHHAGFHPVAGGVIKLTLHLNKDKVVQLPIKHLVRETIVYSSTFE